MNRELTSTQRRALRAKAHPLHPVVLIGDNGLTEAVMTEIEVSLRSHELIKVRAQGEREERDAWFREICERLAAQPVQHIGKTLVLYRERPPEPIPEPAPRRGRAAPKRPAPAAKRPARASPKTAPTPRAQSKRGADRAAGKRPARSAPKAAPAPRAQSKRGADRARARVNAERAPAKAPARRRAGTR
jgi:RNA-binding protein